MVSVQTGRKDSWKEAPRGGEVKEPAARLGAMDVAAAAASSCAVVCAVPHAPVVWESPEPRLVEPNPDMFAVDVTLRRHGMCNGANCTTERESARDFAVQYKDGYDLRRRSVYHS